VTSDAQTEWAERIRAALPGLSFTTLEIEDYGEDYHVLILDRAWVVRAPRTAEYLWRFEAELSLVATLAPVSPLPVPAYEFVAADKNMGAYRLIAGVELTPPIFALMHADAQHAALARLGRFLTVLHALPEDTIRLPDGMIQRRWSGEQYAARYRGMRRAKIVRVMPPATMARFDAFHEALAIERAYVPRLAHDDLTEDHILAGADGTLAGVIDFGDAAWGDPASDFAWFWRLGEGCVDEVLSHYGHAALDPELKQPSRWNYARFLINQIAYGDAAKWNLSPDRAEAEVGAHLRALGF